MNYFREMKNNKITIVTTFYNAGKYFDLCMNSVLSQKYDNFNWVVIDDASEDNNFDKIPDRKNIIKIRNRERKGDALPNTHDALINYCESDSIYVNLDGEDWLINKHVLSYINDFYNKHNCMMVYGQCRWYNPEPQFKRFEEKGLAYPITDDMFKELRNGLSWPFSHIRTFRAKAYHSIKDQDPNYDCLKDKNGEFLISMGDVAVMLPVAEIVGYKNIKYNDKVLYVYNRENELNIDKVHGSSDIQSKNHLEVNSKPKFKQIFF